MANFPEVSGEQLFLVDTGVDTPESEDQSHLLVAGTDVCRSRNGCPIDSEFLLADLMAVQNTYLSTFQSLGGFGLLLGTLGLAVVEVRNVLERRRELALLTAVGFPTSRLRQLVIGEHFGLLLAGLTIGCLAALVTVLPHQWAGQRHGPPGCR